MKVCICGSRTYDNARRVHEEMDKIHRKKRVKCVISGGAAGADTFGVSWAYSEDIPVEPYYADWEEHGRRAGPMRNEQMIVEGKPDLVVAFGDGKGTQDMVRRTIAAGIRLIRFDDPHDPSTMEVGRDMSKVKGL
jgi:hypothetical protein